MSVYDVDKLMQEARKLAANYRAATGKPLGISNEIAVHDVMRLMQLQPAPIGDGGYDAIGTGMREGKLIQIKGRTISPGASSSQRIGQIKVEQEWDSIMLILMDEQYEPVAIYEADRDVILEAVEQTSAKRRSRGALSVNRFKKIGRCVWAREDQAEAAQADESAP
jgi:hypothetical protein